MELAIETKGITKFYDNIMAVSDLNWQVPVGSACAFLGTNGSGKTTTLRMLMGFTAPSRGSCQILGEDPWKITPETRSRIGYVSEQAILPPWMKVEKLIEFHSSYYPNWDREREKNLRELFEISSQQRISNLSKGQHRRLMVLLALCQGSDLLVLDEPGAGMDVSARRKFLNLLGEYLTDENKTIIISTHIVTDIERIASHIAILKDGCLLVFAPLDELKEKVKRIRLLEKSFQKVDSLWSKVGVLSIEDKGASKIVTVSNFSMEAQSSLKLMAGEDVEVLDLPLEEIFLAYVENDIVGNNGN